VEGFTDSVGSEEFNQVLSERRADAVREALLARGVDPSRIAVHGFGESYPVASNDNSAGRQLNRRVEIVVANSDQAVPPRMQ
jgi:outer membrane protein OmpA-like peptidoglycan-associated protein